MIEHPAGPRYRSWLRAGGVRVSMDPLEAWAAHNECPGCGRVPAEGCRCKPTPDLMETLTRAEEAAA